MLGMLFGSYFFGWMSDTLGRVNALVMAVITVSLPGFFGYFLDFFIVVNYILFYEGHSPYFKNV